MNLNEIPQLGVALTKSFMEMGMESIIPRIGLEEIGSVSMKPTEPKVRLEILQFTFLVVSTSLDVPAPEKPITLLPPMEPGLYEFDIDEILEGDTNGLSVTIRQIGITLDGSREKFLRLTDECMN